MAKDNRFKYEYRKNASKLHKSVGEILRHHPVFKDYSSFQEYPVNKVNPDYPNGSHKFDWVVTSLKIVIEAHGIQHKTCQTFGADVEDAIEAFHEGKKRDEAKEQAAIDAGWTYIVVWYNEKVTADLILDKIREAREVQTRKIEDSPPDESKERNREYQQERRKQFLSSDKHKQQLAKAREYRKQQYKRIKEMKNESD